MESDLFPVESSRLFSESKIWELNRDFYTFRGLSAFSEDIVPHHLTSNALVSNTYAEIILGLLCDLRTKGQTEETVYILELGAGHGRLAFQVLSRLRVLVEAEGEGLPPYCYVLSDVVEGSLAYFLGHPQLKEFFEEGTLDVTYFDATESEELALRRAGRNIRVGELSQPLVALANYFFDSIPTEMFYVKDATLSNCLVSIAAKEDPAQLNPEELIRQLQLSFERTATPANFYADPLINGILEDYRRLVDDTYLFFPEVGMQCIGRIQRLSTAGMLLLSIDKGFHEVRQLNEIKNPDVVTHGSLSIWVNFHALGAFCERQGGMALLPTSSNFHLELGAFLFLEDPSSYGETQGAYRKFVNDFGPDDFNTLKHMTYRHLSRLNTQELLALYRLSGYDSTFFGRILPRLKQVASAVTFNERKRIAEAMHRVWSNYFHIGEKFDLPYEIGGVLYDLGFYAESLVYFDHSMALHGPKPDTFYNLALGYYQLRQDKQFYATIAQGRAAFPDYPVFDQLGELDMEG